MRVRAIINPRAGVAARRAVTAIERSHDVWEIEIQMTTGYAAADFSQASLPLLTTSSSSMARSKVVGTGIPGRPIIVSRDSDTSVILPTTSQQLPDNPGPQPDTKRRILYWKELL